MKKILAIVLAVVMIFSMSAIAFADDTGSSAPETTTAAPAVNFNIAESINNIINQIVAALQGDVLATIQGYIQQIVNAIEGLLPQSDVLGAVADLEGALGGLNLGGDLFSYVKNLINTLKQKIKDFYCHETETVVEETEAEAPVDTGSTSIGIVAFAAVSVAAAAAYVCTRKKED
jgi:hypothetical protein